MIKRVLDSKLPLAVYNPAGLFCPDYFESVHRAGALPVYDTEFADAAAVRKNISAMESRGILFGIRVYAEDADIIKILSESNSVHLSAVILAYKDAASLEKCDLSPVDARTIVEVKDIGLTRLVEKQGASAVLVRGNEAGGLVSKYTSFVLLQWYIENSDLPVIVHGGAGYFTAAGMFAAGASGVVLDDQLYLTNQAPIADNFKQAIAKLEEKDTMMVGQSLSRQYRFFSKLATKNVKVVKEHESLLLGDDKADEKLYTEICRDFAKFDDNSIDVVQSLFYLGQDALMARYFIKDSTDVEVVIPQFFKKIGELLADVDAHDPMHADSPLAKENGVKYPIIQGPMANISDNADFANSVFEHGALPFLAMGSLPKNLAQDMIQKGIDKVPTFGAGMIGIASLNKELDTHMGILKELKVKYALFASGNPAQVKELEAVGIKTYLHTPAASILENAVTSGAMRCIFEGREAGGHVGAMTSMVLWETAIQKVVNSFADKIGALSLIFAGGIASSSGARFISGMTSNLAKRGAKIGIQVSTSYLFSKEIVSCGAIKPLYQRLMKEKTETIVTGETLGLSTRSLPTPFTMTTVHREHERVKQGMPLQDRKLCFEKDNLGALLVGAKAYRPNFSVPGKVTLDPYTEQEAFEVGNFMSGDALIFHNEEVAIDDIHCMLMGGKGALAKVLDSLEVFSSPSNEVNDEIAIVGMGCIYPESTGYEELWKNILDKKYFIKKVDDSRLDSTLYYNTDKSVEDKTYTNIAATVDQFVFDYKKYGYSAEEAAVMSRTQQMILEAAHMAAADAGYSEKKSLPKNASVIIGTCLGNEVAHNLTLKYYYPEVKHYLEENESYKSLSEGDKEKLLAAIREKMSYGITGETPDSFFLNIEAARIARHLGLEGANFVIDAACATSFAAVDSAVKELLSGSRDAVVVGGINTNMMPEPFVGFSNMGTLSAEGSYPFDGRANGFVMGEGAGVFVLKRVKDAMREGDRIHAVIKAIGGSSDGKGKGIAAPSQSGQALALTRCYEKMKDGTTVNDIDFIETHGTSTLVGDKTEIDTIKSVYKTQNKIGISSIKSQIGHLLGGAGAAGMTKAILAIKNKKLPPNGQFKNLSPRVDFSGSNLFIVADTQEWAERPGKTRKAAVSSYGFGGINYHVVLEECSGNYRVVPRRIFADPTYDFNDSRIVIAGIGVMAPGAKSKDEFLQLALSGDQKFVPLPAEKYHAESYANESGEYFIPKTEIGYVSDYKINNLKYRIPPAAADHIERAQFFALDAAGQALDESGVANHLGSGNRVAVILGTMSGAKNAENIFRVRIPQITKGIDESGIAKEAGQAISESLSAALKSRYVKNTGDTIPGLLSNIVTGRVCNVYGCNGANFTVDSSCASSAVAVDLAIKGLKNGDFEFALTGGVDTNLFPLMMHHYDRLGILAESASPLFDMRSSGVLMGEAGVVFALTTWKSAKKHKMPVIAEINGVGIVTRGAGDLFQPSDRAYAEVIRKTLRSGNVAPKSVRQIEVYAGGNLLFDQAELNGIGAALPAAKVPFSSGRTQIGHTRAASGAISMLRMALAARESKIFAVKSWSKDSSIVKERSSVRALTETAPLTQKNNSFGANSFGHGGAHAHYVLSTFPEWLKNSAEAKPAVNARPAEAVASSSAAKCALILSGQGAQRSGMMKEAYEKFAPVREIIDRGDAIFTKARGYSIKALMFNDPEDKLSSTENTQPAVFLSSAAMYALLRSRGFNADYFAGHSLGEFSALYCAGVFTFEDAFSLVIRRGEIMKRAADAQKGAIMVLFCGADEAASLISEAGVKVYVANKNSDKQTAVAGEGEAVDAFCAYLKQKGVTYKKLALSGAFHTPLFEKASAEMGEALRNVACNVQALPKVVANLSAQCYPASESEAKEILRRQMISPVEFVQTVKNLSAWGVSTVVEAGPGNLLTKLVGDISASFGAAVAMIDVKKGESASCEAALGLLEGRGLLSGSAAAAAAPRTAAASVSAATYAMPVTSAGVVHAASSLRADGDFEAFLKNNDEAIKKLLFDEYLKAKKDEAFKFVDMLGLYTGAVVIPGVSIGLPGLSNKVFNADNFERILRGTNCIDRLSDERQQEIIDKNITRIFKDPSGSARYVQITSTDDVVHLAGQLGYFNLQSDYGVEFRYDITSELAIAAGLEALKDAKIPLVMNYKRASNGTVIPDRMMLPSEMQSTTGVIFTSLFPGFESLIEEIGRFYTQKFAKQPAREFEKLYYFLMEKVADEGVKSKITDWFFNLKKNISGEEYAFSRNLLVHILSLGSAHFAQFIGARGPNMQVNGACASTTQAVAVASDWIRMGRCERVIIIGGEAATSPAQNRWITSGFLALGAASIKKTVQEAARPFDETRNGMIVGSGAVGIIVERQDRTQERGMNGQAQILGTHIGNSAFHVSKIDVQHLAEDMESFFNKTDALWNLDRNEYTKKMIFMSHETYTPARGGSADAEVEALKRTFGAKVNEITVTNTKGYTGHTLGAGIEDAVLVKAMQTGTVPPIPNLENIPAHFKDLKFSKGEKGDFEYGFHLGAGFGSHFAFLFVKRITENSDSGNQVYKNWLSRITGKNDALPYLKNSVLVADCAVNGNVSANGKSAAPAAPAPVSAPAAAAAPVKAAGADAKSIIPRIKAIIAEQTGYDIGMLDETLDLEADLGIDTVKQVEIFGKISANYSLEVPEDLKLADLNTIEKLAGYIAAKAGPTASVQGGAAAATAASAGDFIEAIKGIIAEQTGYDKGMLDATLDLEADLGIDTVKQVEIFGKISANYSLEVPEDLKLADLNTIEKLAGYIAAKTGGVSAASVVGPQGSAVQQGMTAAVSGAGFVEAIKGIIAEQTGYESSMLDATLDLEADLGIDTVKQVEIFGKISANYSLEVPEDLKLADLNTIEKLAEYIAVRTQGTASQQGSTTQQAAVAPKGTPAAVSGAGFVEAIKGIIAEQTGYESTMLDATLDLEADLGIDTVKQVEIFGKISANYSLEVPEDLKLADLNTIEKLAEYIAMKTQGAASPKSSAAQTHSAAAAHAPVAAAAGADNGIKTFSVLTKEQPLKGAGGYDFAGKKFLVSPDSAGFAEKLKAAIEAAGGSVVTIGGEGCDHKIAFDSIDECERDIAALAKLLAIDGYFHFAVADAVSEKKRGTAEMNRFVKSAFLVAKHFAPQLDKEGAMLASIAFNSVVFAYRERKGEMEPLFAAIAGMFKTLNKEFAKCTVKVVDFSVKSPSRSSAKIIEIYFAEIKSGNREVEIGYEDSTRYALSLKVKEPDKGESMVSDGDTILVTGGARGITYNILSALVKKYRVNLIIAGRSDIASVDAKYLAPGVGEKEVMDDLKNTMSGAKPVEIKKAAGRIMQMVESVRNIESLKASGAQVVYYAADVASFDSMKAIVDKHEKIDGIIHAAGVDESQFITKKDAASFNRVFDTKVQGLYHLLALMGKREYRFLSTFSSVTARFGNEGQCDYTAANDMIGKMVQAEKSRNANLKVKVYDWTAWEGAGMATNETVHKVLESRGLVFLPLAYGVKCFIDDLCDAREEVLVSGMDHEFDRDRILPRGGDRVDLMLDKVIEQGEGFKKFSRMLDLKRDVFILDHVKDGVPLFLGATGLETMAEASRQVADGVLVGMQNYKIPYGIKLLKGRPKEILASARKNGATVTADITSVFKNPAGVVMGDPTLHYQADFIFADKPLESKKIVIPPFKAPEIKGSFQEMIYHPERLFMDGLFRTVEELVSFEPTRMITTIANTSDRDFFAGEKEPEFTTDPVLVDAMFQTGGMLEVMTSEQIILPYMMKQMRFYKAPQKNVKYLCITEKTAAGDEYNSYNLVLCTTQGDVLLEIEEFQMVRVGHVREGESILDRIKMK